MTLCIIPARGGSKRFVKKNIAQIANKPLICWTIEEAIKSKSFDNSGRYLHNDGIFLFKKKNNFKSN